jgi:cytochrome oxidase Cu insertion factor (SCO1/SenC/PrrC family)
MMIWGGTMRHWMTNIFLIIALSLAGLPGVAQEPKKEPEPLALKAGDTAPDFTLLHYDGQGVKPVSLRDFRGKKKVVVAFFVFAFTGG